MQVLGFLGTVVTVGGLFFGCTVLTDWGRALWPLLAAVSLLAGLAAGLVGWGVLPWWAYILSLGVLVVGYRFAYPGRFGSQLAVKRRGFPRITWRRAALSALIIFTIAMGALMAVEVAAGQGLCMVAGGCGPGSVSPLLPESESPPSPTTANPTPFPSGRAGPTPDSFP